MTAPVAFVIPAFNAAAVVAEAVASAFGQTVAPAEIIVVDDGSADGTALLAQRAGATVRRQSNRGPGAARNAGIASTSAEWIALLDADDVSYPARLEIQLRASIAPDVAVIHAATAAADGPHRDRSPNRRRDAHTASETTFGSLWQRSSVITSTVLLRRAAWEAVGGFDERLELVGAEDYNLWLRLAGHGWRFVHSHAVVGEYRGTAASVTLDTARCVTAELLNARVIASEFDLGDKLLRDKEFRIYRQYGIDHFYRRDFAEAWPLLREAVNRNPADWNSRIRAWLALAAARLRRTRPTR